MGRRRFLVISCGLLIMALISPPPVWATKPTINPLKVTGEMIPYPKGPGPISLGLTISPKESRFHFDTVKVVVSRVDNLHLCSPDTMIVPFDAREQAICSISLVIPANDTSGIELSIEAKGVWQPADFYWVALPDTIELHHGDPRLSPKAMAASHMQRIDSSGHMLDVEAAKYPHGRGGIADEHGNPVSQEKIDSLLKEIERKKNQPIVNPPLVPDTSYMLMMTDSGRIVVKKSDYLPNRKKQDLEKMRKMEEQPLTAYNREDFTIDGQVWTRTRGEYKFHPAVPITDYAAGGRRIADSLGRIYAGQAHEVTLDLRDPKDYEVARRLVDSLMAMEPAGYYRAVAKGSILKQLRGKGIKDAPYPQLPVRDAQPRGM